MKINTNKNQIETTNNKQGVDKGLHGSFNALILAKQIVVKGESKQEFVDFAERLHDSLHISTPVEAEIFKKYIFSMWKLRRAREMEKNLLNRQQVFEKEQDTYSDWGTVIPPKAPIKKRRIRDISRLWISEELQEIITLQDRLEKQTNKILRQLREEQGVKERLIKFY